MMHGFIDLWGTSDFPALTPFPKIYQALRLPQCVSTFSKVSNTQRRTTVGSFSSYLSWQGDRRWHKHQKDCSAPLISNSYNWQFNLLKLPWSRASGAPVNQADAKYSRHLHAKTTLFFIKKKRGACKLYPAPWQFRTWKKKRKKRNHKHKSSTTC